MTKINDDDYGSWGVPHDSTTLISFTKDFMVVPDIVGWKYIPRTQNDNIRKDRSSKEKSC
tara:strand:+ start:207 stop:386 length:180 start_codon:yes stop_codon:yes gene_type:complete